VEVREDRQDILVTGPSGTALRLKRPGSAFRTLLDNLARGGMERNSICDKAMGAATAADDNDGAGLARLYFALSEIERKGFLRYTITERGRALATLEPVAPVFRLKDISIDGKFLLSRFACLRRVGSNMMVESPLGHARVVIHDGRGAALLALLATPHTAAELATAMHEINEATVAAFIALLANAKAASACTENGHIAEDDNVRLRQWEFHDLLFHTRSRLGRHNYPYGGTFRFLDVLQPLPAVRPPGRGRRIALYKPDMRALEASDVSFSRVTEARRSVRTQGEQPLSAAQLGEFLYRAARVKEVYPVSREHGSPYEASIRPCASGGAMHELELYLTLSRCAGIEPGLYHYDPLEHELERLADLDPRQKRLLADARASSGLDTPPDVLITLAARFQRVAWKYQSMAYAAILKNTGALYQQMYLVATAMNLAPCGLGGGDSDLFAEVTGLDYYAETSVGEFMLSGHSPNSAKSADSAPTKPAT
jgi:SagB-type dehydrogenase family enzyme